MDKPDYDATFEHDIEMMKYFQEEFMFRQAHYWEILIKLFTLTIVITILPIATEVFGISLSNIPHEFLLCFPGLGVIISLLSLFLLGKEAKKIKAVNEAKYRINRQCMDEKYHYEYYNDEVGKGDSNRKKWLSFQIIWVVFALELIVIIGVSIVILSTPAVMVP